MRKNAGYLTLALAGTFLGSNAPVAAQPVESCADRTNSTKKGSLLVWPKVELRWDSSGNLIQDTVIELSNDFPSGVRFQMYFINGDAPLPEDLDTGERAHPGWNWVDVAIFLTANQPTYWSAATGLPATGGVSPFTILDPGSPPGRPDPDGSDERVLRGYIVGWAVDSVGAQIRFNHLKGSATLLNYSDASAWEYNAYAFQACTEISHGTRVGSPGYIQLDGRFYDAGYDFLLLDFFAVGSLATSGAGRILESDTDLTLHPLSADLRMASYGPVTTKADFEIFNQNEVKFSGAFRCITCWDQTLLSQYGDPDHFFISNLQTNKGRARINGVFDPFCGEFCRIVCADNVGSQAAATEDCWESCDLDESLLGVQMKRLDVDSGTSTIRAGMNLHGTGTEFATIAYDVNTDPIPENPTETDTSSRPVRNATRSTLSAIGGVLPAQAE